VRSARSVLALKYTPVSVAGGVRKAVGGFLRYVQFRDQHAEPEVGGLDAYMRYIAHRDRTSPAGRVFGINQDRVDVDRRRLVDYVLRSTKGLAPKWVEHRNGKLRDHQRAVYTFVLSPEDWRGLDLRRLARAAMQQLEADAGSGGIGPWFAAEHRNTAHHHVHIVLAARRELEPGTFSTLLINRSRLQKMKEAIGREISLQRGLVPERSEKAPRHRLSARVDQAPRRHHQVSRWREQRPRRTFVGLRTSPIGHIRGGQIFGVALLRLRSAASRYQHQMERELEEELVRREREGWLR
jgi:hypothetical protein